MADKDWVDVRNAAKWFGVHECTIRACVKNGQIYGIRIGKQIRIPMTELKRLQMGNTSTPPTA